MQIDRAIFAIEPRTVGGCIDLAIVFLREHLWGMLRLTACFAVPFCWLSWWLVSREDWTLPGSMFLFFLVTPFAGAVLVGTAGHRVFGERFSVRTGLKLVTRRFILLTVLILISRAVILFAGMMVIVPGYLIATRYGFLSEVLVLEQAPLKRYEARINDLLKHAFGSLLGRLISILTFYTATVCSLFVLIDAASGLLFSYPVLSGRISDMSYAVDEITVLLTRDPLVSTTLLAVMWLVYPVARLAWFFCYLDVRIRKEGWDIELDFRVEAARLGEAA